jgi:hypothetical protein
MFEFPQSFETARSQAMARVTEAMLRALGGSAITVRLPQNVAQENADLGLASPVTEDVVLTPAVGRAVPAARGEVGLRVELIISAASVAEQAASRNFDSPDALLDNAIGIVHNDKLLRVRSVDIHAFADDPAFYRITATE